MFTRSSLQFPGYVLGAISVADAAANIKHWIWCLYINEICLRNPPPTFELVKIPIWALLLAHVPEISSTFTHSLNFEGFFSVMIMI